jgi:hypothetical protein
MLKKEIVMAENERDGKMNWKRMGVTAYTYFDEIESSGVFS